MGSGASSFPATDWSLLEKAAAGDGSIRNHDLEALLARYLPAMRAYVRTTLGLSDADADDLVQSFIFDKVIQGTFLEQADRGRGRFRSLLMTALNHHLVSSIRRNRAAKRSPDRLHPIDSVEALLTDRGQTPDQIFDRTWALHVLQEAAGQMREHCEAIGRDGLWLLFRHRVYDPALSGGAPAELGTLCLQLGISGAAEASNLLTTARRMYRRFFRQSVAAYTRPELVDDEVAHLTRYISRRT